MTLSGRIAATVAAMAVTSAGLIGAGGANAAPVILCGCVNPTVPGGTVTPPKKPHLPIRPGHWKPLRDVIQFRP